MSYSLGCYFLSVFVNCLFCFLFVSVLSGQNIDLSDILQVAMDCKNLLISNSGFQKGSDFALVKVFSLLLIIPVPLDC